MDVCLSGQLSRGGRGGHSFSPNSRPPTFGTPARVSENGGWAEAIEVARVHSTWSGGGCSGSQEFPGEEGDLWLFCFSFSLRFCSYFTFEWLALPIRPENNLSSVFLPSRRILQLLRIYKPFVRCIAIHCHSERPGMYWLFCAPIWNFVLLLSSDHAAWTQYKKTFFYVIGCRSL